MKAFPSKNKVRTPCGNYYPRCLQMRSLKLTVGTFYEHTGKKTGAINPLSRNRLKMSG